MTTGGARPWGLVLVAALALPPLRQVLEGTMVGHMLVQIPLLIVAGALLAIHMPPALRRASDRFNANGVPGILAAGFVASYWMLPRALDAALSSPFAELAKFCTLPLLVGLPLALSWPRLAPVWRGFVVANAISMIAVAGWLYREYPTRLCSWYLADQQVLLGDALLVLAVLAGIAWTVRVFAGPQPRARPATDAADRRLGRPTT